VLDTFTGLPIAIPACGGGGIAVEQHASRCWKSADGTDMRCYAAAVSDAGLCERHLKEMRVEATT
jgi:hypothetical protein